MQEKYYWENGTMAIEMRYNSKGIPTYEKHYHKDKNADWFKAYHSNGKPSLETFYENGKKSRESWHNSKGILEWENRFTKDGDIIRQK